MSIIYNDLLFKGKKLLFAVVDQANVKSIHYDLFSKMKDLTFTYTTRISDVTTRTVEYFDDIDTAMSSSNDYDIVIIQSIGNFITNNELLHHLEEYYSANPNFFMLSFTLDWESEKGTGWIECHHQMIVINCKTWREIGSPKYGSWELKTEPLPNYTRSVENFHDKYTPLWIKGAPGTSIKTRTCQGWGFIKAALENNLQVDNFSQEMRNCRLFVYPESDSIELYNSFLTRDPTPLRNPNQKKWIRSLTRKPTIWIYNSEHYTFNTNISCDVYFGPAAGFKYLDILNYNTECEFIFYDFNQLSLDWIEHLKKTWDGDDYPNYLNNQSDEFKKCYKYINSTIENNQNKLFADFQSEEHFKKLWGMFQNSKAKFIKCDLFDASQITNLLDATNGIMPFIYFSNIFSTDFTIIDYTFEDALAKYQQFIDMSSKKFPTATFYGSDPLGNWSNL